MRTARKQSEKPQIFAEVAKFCATKTKTKENAGSSLDAGRIRSE